MELIVDHEPKSVVAKAVNLYSRANVKTVELGVHSVEHLNVTLPVLASKEALRYPLSIYSTLSNLGGVGNLLLGESVLEKAQVSSWVELASSIPANDFLDHLEKKLLSRTFLVSNHVTVADLAAYAVVQKTIGGVTFAEKNRFPCIMRWASHLMSLPGLGEVIPLFEIPFKVNKVMETYENLIRESLSGQPEVVAAKPGHVKEEGAKKQEEGKKKQEEGKKKQEEGKKKQEEGKKKQEEGKKQQEGKQGQEKKQQEKKQQEKKPQQPKGKQKQGAQPKEEGKDQKKEDEPVSAPASETNPSPS